MSAYDLPAPRADRLPRTAKAYIHKLEERVAADAQLIAERDVRIDELTRRLDALEEQYRLALARQYATKREKRRDRVFNEAEEAAQTEPADEDSDNALTLPDTGLPELDQPEPRKRGRKPLPADLPRERIEYDLPEDQKICPCARIMQRLTSTAIPKSIASGPCWVLTDSSPFQSLGIA